MKKICSGKPLMKGTKKVCRYYYSALQKFYEKKDFCHKGGKVFLFHQITDNIDDWIDTDCAISRRGFREFITALCNNGAVFGTIDELTKTEYGSKIFLTFDDIYSDVVEYALPILKEKSIPFCVFISDCYIGQNKYISEEQLAGLIKEKLCTIGYHTKFHKILRYMTEEEVINEVEPTSLENIIGKKIKHFAYPYGSLYAVSEQNIITVKSIGYKSIFSTMRLEIDDEIKRKYDGFLPRININEGNYIRYI
jgi:Predicted xylanase/chitin deacetylase